MHRISFHDLRELVRLAHISGLNLIDWKLLGQATGQEISEKSGNNRISWKHCWFYYQNIILDHESKDIWKRKLRMPCWRESTLDKFVHGSESDGKVWKIPGQEIEEKLRSIKWYSFLDWIIKIRNFLHKPKDMEHQKIREHTVYFTRLSTVNIGQNGGVGAGNGLKTLAVPGQIKRQDHLKNHEIFCQNFKKNYATLILHLHFNKKLMIFWTNQNISITCKSEKT